MIQDKMPAATTERAVWERPSVARISARDAEIGAAALVDALNTAS